MSARASHYQNDILSAKKTNPVLFFYKQRSISEYQKTEIDKNLNRDRTDFC